MKLRRILLILTALLLLLAKFALDVIAMNVSFGAAGISLFREGLTVGAFILLFRVLHTSLPHGTANPVRRLGMLLIGAGLLLATLFLLSTLPADGFEAKEFTLRPKDYATLFVASLASVIACIYAILCMRFLRDLVLQYRKRWTARNFLALVILILATSASTLLVRPLDTSVLSAVLYGFAIAVGVVNAFRLPWIVYLTKREKMLTLAFSFLLFILLTTTNIYLSQSTLFSRAVSYCSPASQKFIALSLLFSNIYVGMAFVSTLFHLPTAEAFDRKRSEVSSIHTLSKLVTQVFDFGELVETVTSMTLQVCEARSCWLEIIPYADDDLGDSVPGIGVAAVQIAGLKNITAQEVEDLHDAGLRELREKVLADRKPLVIDALDADPRLGKQQVASGKIASLVVVPLVSHVGPLGFLYATKSTEYGFMKDDIDVISTFADQATVAIENSRLIRKSIERERLVREMTLAQEMQKKLLPQSLPLHPHIEIGAMSTPAFEVGGDYYDFIKLSGDRLGIIVGDVSGKGVPAAFYMSEVKGIFQSLSSQHVSPREFMIQANAVLAGSIDKHSFVSLIYGILDMGCGRLTLARAGHCPMVYVGQTGAEYIRPDGMGLGLSEGSLFADSIEEHALQLYPGDVCLFYTDGITEAHRYGDEYGYERLLTVAGDSRGISAANVKERVLQSVDTFIEHGAPHDDLTLVVLRWVGPDQRL
jgi:serine phosphatase RsbU (regulator of sigma subunit)